MARPGENTAPAINTTINTIAKASTITTSTNTIILLCLLLHTSFYKNCTFFPEPYYPQILTF